MDQRFTKEYPVIRNALFLLLVGILICPLFAGAGSVGGESLLWTGRVTLLGENLTRGFSLFLPGDIVANENLGTSTFVSNLGLMVPGLLARLGLDAFLALKVWMGILQLLGILTAGICAEKLFGKTYEGLAAWVAFVTCPYRVLIFSLKWDPSEALVWTVIPLLIISLSLMEKSRKRIPLFAIGIGTLSLAVIAYADMTVFPLVSGAVLVAALWMRKPLFLVNLVGGTVFSAPAVVYYLRYILKGGMEVYGIPDDFIQASGYRFGQFFTAYAFRYFYPGFGIALMLGLLGYLILEAAGMLPEKTRERRRIRLLVGMVAVLCFAASHLFPWNRIMNLWGVASRFLAVLETPVVFAGGAQILASGIFGLVVKQIRSREGWGCRNLLPGLAVAAAVLNALWICNSVF